MTRAIKHGKTPEEKKVLNAENHFERQLRALYPHAPACTVDVGVVWCVCGATDKRKASRAERRATLGG